MAAVRNGIAECTANLLDRGLLRGVAARLFRNADQYVCRAAELLQLNVAKAETVQRRSHGADIGSARFGLDLEQRAALEIDAEVQPVGKKQRDRDNRKQC